jgi:hypothetical protein
MKGASIYKLKDAYIIYSLSKARSGFNIAGEPYFKMPLNTDKVALITAIKNAVNNSKEEVPDPTDWKVFKKTVITSIGIKSWNDLEKIGNLHCDIALDANNDFIFTPSKHAAPPDKGFLYKSKDHAIRVSATTANDEIAKSLDLALSKCE